VGLQHGIDVGPEQKIGKADNASANPRRPVDTARAATVPVDQVLAALAVRGVDRIEDFFDRNAAGILTFRSDLQSLPVEISIALLRCLREGLGIMNGSP
jgi:hypothetical protein